MRTLSPTVDDAKWTERRSYARVDEPAGVALWRQVVDELERMIGSGHFPAGSKLPSETDVAKRFRVNRHTVRRALAELAERGIVRAKRGSGTFVEMPRLHYPIGVRTRFSEIVNTAGHRAGGRLVGHAEEPVSAEIAARLALAASAKVIRLDILRSVDRVPIALATSWLSAERAPKAVRDYRASRSITRVLERAGIGDYRRHSTKISAAIAEAADATRLRLAPGRPLVTVESVDVALDGQPILTTRTRFAADRIELVVES